MSDEDDRLQRMVLDRLLDAGPVTVEQLVREVAGDSAGFAEHDRVERAVRDLVRAGLVRWEELGLAATGAARRFGKLVW